MPKITAILHTSNDALRIGRALDTLRVCDEVIVVDHDSTDETAKAAKEHGATVKIGVPGVEPGAYVFDARHDWILCLQANEALNEALEAALHEWKEHDPGDAVGYRVRVREESGEGWTTLGPHLRLVNRKRMNWPDRLPPDGENGYGELAGEVMRFATP